MKNEDVSWEVWGRAQLLFTVTNLLVRGKTQSEHLLDLADAKHSNTQILVLSLQTAVFVKEIQSDAQLLSYLLIAYSTCPCWLQR